MFLCACNFVKTLFLHVLDSHEIKHLETRVYQTFTTMFQYIYLHKSRLSTKIASQKNLLSYRLLNICVYSYFFKRLKVITMNKSYFTQIFVKYRLFWILIQNKVSVQFMYNLNFCIGLCLNE